MGVRRTARQALVLMAVVLLPAAARPPMKASLQDPAVAPQALRAARMPVEVRVVVVPAAAPTLAAALKAEPRVARARLAE